MTTVLILILKTIENILSTIRIILLSKNNKLISAILNSIIATFWIISAITVFKTVSNTPINIIAFILGSFLGSYIGSNIEYMLNNNNYIITCISDKKQLINKLKSYNTVVVDGYHYDKYKKIILITAPRKEKYSIIRKIKKIDEAATILCEKTSI